MGFVNTAHSNVAYAYCIPMILKGYQRFALKSTVSKILPFFEPFLESELQKNEKKMVIF